MEKPHILFTLEWKLFMPFSSRCITQSHSANLKINQVKCVLGSCLNYFWRSRYSAQPQICRVKKCDRNCLENVLGALSTSHQVCHMNPMLLASSVMALHNGVPRQTASWSSCITGQIEIPTSSFKIQVKENKTASNTNTEMWINGTSKGFHFNVFAATIKTL